MSIGTPPQSPDPFPSLEGGKGRPHPAGSPSASLVPEIRFAGISKFYGEVLGVNRVDLTLGAGITALVGPNGSGKSTLMNLAAGLLQPSRGTVTVFGEPPDDPERLGRLIGYAPHYEGFPRGATGLSALVARLRLGGLSRADAEQRAWTCLAEVGLTDAARKKIAAYSKGMRQRIKLALAVCHRPAALLLDEPLNGLDPLARSETLDLFRRQADAGLLVVVSSHILHEVDAAADRVVLVNAGYVVAEGDIHGVREEMDEEHPVQVLVRCDRPGRLAARLLEHDHVTEVQVHDDRGGISVRTRDADGFYRLLNQVVVEEGLAVEAVAPGDADVGAVYRYLIEGGAR